jgi:hypothetical protein
VTSFTCVNSNITTQPQTSQTLRLMVLSYTHTVRRSKDPLLTFYFLKVAVTAARLPLVYLMSRILTRVYSNLNDNHSTV